MENNIDNADSFLLKRNDIIGEPSYPERMFWAELLVEYGKLLQSDVNNQRELLVAFFRYYANYKNNVHEGSEEEIVDEYLSNQ